MNPVVVEVNRGIARVVERPKSVKVEIIDLDLLREGADEDIERYWNASLSPAGRHLVRVRHPEIAKPLSSRR
jgi:hypothetical protein